MKLGHVKHCPGTRKRILLWQAGSLSELQGLALENPTSFITTGKETAARVTAIGGGTQMLKERWCALFPLA